VWAVFLEEVGETADRAWVLQSVERGVKMEFCRPHDERKGREPLHSRQLVGVTRALREAGFTEQEVARAMDHDFPPSCWLGNRLQIRSKVFLSRRAS
jgi:hypothetical protein